MAKGLECMQSGLFGKIKKPWPWFIWLQPTFHFKFKFSILLEALINIKMALIFACSQIPFHAERNCMV